MFGDRMKTSAIPERVYALCREVSNKPMDEAELKSILQPQLFKPDSQYFGNVRTAAEQLQLISVKENVVSLAVDKNVVKSMESMRQYINLHIESLSDGLFYKVTQGYLDLGIDVLQFNSVSKMSDTMGKMIGVKVTEDDMRAWRFWMGFLCFGYMHEPDTRVAGILIPNVAIFLKDIIEGLGIKKSRQFRIDEFVAEVTPYANIALHNANETKSFNYAFSNAIRMLHDLHFIKAEHRLDSQEIWALYPFEGHDIETTITHITIGG